MRSYKSISTTFTLSAALVLAGCGSEEAQGDATLEEELEYTITGIEPGAGLTELATNALEDYDNLEGWELEESSTASMVTALGEAIDNEEPIIVTAWTPHWIFAAYDLKYLEDPEGSLGEGESIHTLARQGLEEDMPEAYKILDAFEWDVEDMEAIMLEAQDIPFEEAAQNWIDDNQDLVAQWTEGTQPVDGQKFELVSTPWDSERASANVMRLVLEEQGYDVTLTDVDPAVMFEALASGGADGSVAPWLPIAHGALFEEHKEDLVDLGANVTGAKNGIAVPAYMDIDSLEDLQPKE